MAASGLITFTGLNQILRGSFTLSQGVTPSVCTVEIVPQPPATIPADGTLALVGGSAVLFPGARVDRASFNFTGQGHVWSLSILDRRWKWRFGEISGHYNVRRDDGRIDSDTERSPQQLAAACLVEMGEVGFDVSQLPNDLRPQVDWEREVPAQALDALVSRLGCRVVLTHSNRARVVRTGLSSAALPAAPILQDQAVVAPPRRPDKIRVVCGPTKYEALFALEAVGLDVDGEVFEIDDLSYAPAAGWSKVDPFHFGTVSDTPDPDTKEKPRDLALRTVYRWYRIKNEGADGSRDLRIPGWGGAVPGKVVKHLGQVLPLQDSLAATRQATADREVALPPWVEGVFYDQKLSFAETAAGTRCRVEFTLDRERGIVQFSEGVFRLDASAGTYSPAELYLRTGLNVRDEATGALDRYSRELTLPPPYSGTPPEVVRIEEAVLTVVPVYATGNRAQGFQTNEDEIKRQCDYALAAAALKYQSVPGRDVVLAGLVPFSPDGAAQQVTWSAGPDGFTTRVSFNGEWDPAVPTYAERRAALRLRGLDEEYRRLQLDFQNRSR